MFFGTACRSEVEFGMRAETEWLQNNYVWGFFKLLVNDLPIF